MSLRVMSTRTLKGMSDWRDIACLSIMVGRSYTSADGRYRAEVKAADRTTLIYDRMEVDGSECVECKCTRVAFLDTYVVFQ